MNENLSTPGQTIPPHQRARLIVAGWLAELPTLPHPQALDRLTALIAMAIEVAIADAIESQTKPQAK